MTSEHIVNRYSAYYLGWCVAFGEHELATDQERDIQWIFGDDKAGIIIASRLRLRFIRELLGKQTGMPEITLSQASARINHLEYSIEHPDDLEGLQRFRSFVEDAGTIHMFLTSHFCYPTGTRILTFAKKKPLGIMYKEIAPLRMLLL